MAHAPSDARGSTTGVIAASALAAALFFGFALSVSDGLRWKTDREAEIVAPDMEARDVRDARRIPDFALKDRWGRDVRLGDLARADVLLVTVWSSSCPACREDMPALEELDRRLGSLGRVALLTITTDRRWDDLGGVFPSGTDLRVLFDPEEKVTRGIFGTVKFPETFLLDKERRVRARFDGPRDWPSEPMLRYIAGFL